MATAWGRNPNTTAAVSVRSADRAAEAMKLRRQELSYREIAAEMGITHPHAMRLVQKELKLIPFEDVVAYRKQSIERLNRLWESLSDGIDAGDTKSINSGVGIVREMNELLGLKAPERHDIRLANATPDMDALLLKQNAELRAQLAVAQALVEIDTETKAIAS